MQRGSLLLSKRCVIGGSLLMNGINTRRYIGLPQKGFASITDSVEPALESNAQPVVKTSTTFYNVGQVSPSQYGPEPSFEMISSGVGSTLRVKLPPRTEITVFTGSVISLSSHVTSQLILDGNLFEVPRSKLAIGSRFYQKINTDQHPGDILLAPQQMGEITTIQLRGSSKYIVRCDAFLAKTAKATLAKGMDGVKGTQIGLANKLVHSVSGPGTIAISHYGGLYRISLAAGENYLVNPRNLILWESRTAPTRLHQSDPIGLSTRLPWKRYAFIRDIVENPFLCDLLTEAPDFVKLKGPGDFYIASRTEPKFEKLRRTNALATVNDSISQLFEQVSLFPDQTPHQDITTQHMAEASALSNFGKKKHRYPDHAEKSIDGKPSYYAEVGPNGKAIFVSTKE